MRAKSKTAFRRRYYDTRFDRFLAAQGIDLEVLATLIGWTRQNLVRLRSGAQKPSQDTIAKIVLALRAILRRAVAASELFYLGEEHDDGSPEAQEFLRPVA
jgi:transcriptional regulator with XRE-family HTH domain